MRELKFRGRLPSSGEWIYGGYVKIKSGAHCILSGDVSHQDTKDGEKNILKFNAVMYKTVGEYTGLKDKKGKEIYEGDIVKHLIYGGNYPVVYSCENTGYDLKTKRGSMHLGSSCCPNLEVIGNIYLNKDLLKEVKGNGN